MDEATTMDAPNECSGYLPANDRQLVLDGKSLRQRAEHFLRSPTWMAEQLEDLTPEAAKKTLHELRVHQIELEMNNKQLRQSLAELDTSQARYFDFHDMAPVGYCTVSSSGLILQANLTIASTLGTSRDVLLGQPIAHFILPDDQDSYYLMRQQIKDKTEVRSCDLRMSRRDRVPFWAHLIAMAVPDDGTGQSLRIVIADITERKLAQEAVARRELYFRKMIEGGSELFFVMDRAGNVSYRNEFGKQLTGWETPEVLGRPVTDFVSAQSLPLVQQATAEILANPSQSIRLEVCMVRKDGSQVEVEALARNLLDDPDVAGIVITARDITERKAAESQMQDLAFSDRLTGLPNRRLLLDRLQQAITVNVRHERRGALLMVDLDDFKSVNDTDGHDKGDLLLQQVAKSLSACVRDGDTVARVGGDEFVVLLEGLGASTPQAATQAEALGEKMLKALNQTYVLDGYEHHSTASIGITLIGEQSESVEEPLKRSELAMYQAKAAGRNTQRFFDPQMQAVVTARAALEAALREALVKNQFLLYYQAQVNEQQEITSMEALVRWFDPKRGLVSPAEFIPLAEQTGLILPLGEWILEAACIQLALWAKEPALAHSTVAVNVSARQFHQHDFVDRVLAVLDHTGANPRRLKLELTESLLVTNVEAVIAKMNALKGRGVSFSLDDFGTGYSSLSYLKRLPLHQLKIDQGFVRDILTDPNDAAIARMVVALAQSMGLAVMAEGVETDAQRSFLAGLGCHDYQGYLFSRPLPLAEFEAFALRMRAEAGNNQGHQ